MPTFVGNPPTIPPDIDPTDPDEPTPDPTADWQGSFAATEAAISPGDVVEVPDDTYTESFTLTKANVWWLAGNGVIIDLSGESIAIQAAGVNIAGNGIKFGIGDGVQITGSDGAGIAVEGNDVTVTAELHHNVEEGYIWHGTRGLFLNGSNHDNNESGAFHDSGEQGAGKANINGTLVIDGVEVYNIGLGGASDSAGQGLWWDTISGSTPQAWFSAGEVRNCVIHDCYNNGVMFEISRNGSFHDNVIHHCGNSTPRAAFWGAGILISSAQDARIYNNVIAYCENNGVRVVGQSRSDSPGAPADVVTHDNTFIRNGVAIRYDSDDAGVRSVMFNSANGNTAYRNIFNEDDLAVHWNGTTYTTLGGINALPGGGGSTTITEAAADTILAGLGITP